VTKARDRSSRGLSLADPDGSVYLCTHVPAMLEVTPHARRARPSDPSTIPGPRPATLIIARTTPAPEGAGDPVHRPRPAGARPHPVVASVLAALAAFGVLAATACAADDDAEARARSAAGDAAGLSRSVIQPSSRAYREAAVASGGAVRVLVHLDGDVARDSAHRPPAEQQPACGVEVPDESLRRDGDRLEGAVVWLPDVREGKALPIERRYELTIERCRLVPRVLVAVAGGTINLRALDDAAHRTRFVRHADGTRLAEIATTEPISVVPDETVLRQPGQVEVSCDVHPWARAWLMTFDHPYAAVTARDGAARLDSVPAGRWRVVVWHERLGVREDTVEVRAGAESTLEVRLQAR
jgi:hypothetical protein